MIVIRNNKTYSYIYHIRNELFIQITQYLFKLCILLFDVGYNLPYSLKGINLPNSASFTRSLFMSHTCCEISSALTYLCNIISSPIRYHGRTLSTSVKIYIRPLNSSVMALKGKVRTFSDQIVPIDKAIYYARRIWFIKYVLHCILNTVYAYVFL